MLLIAPLITADCPTFYPYLSQVRRPAMLLLFPEALMWIGTQF